MNDSPFPEVEDMSDRIHAIAEQVGLSVAVFPACDSDGGNLGEYALCSVQFHHVLTIPDGDNKRQEAAEEVIRDLRQQIMRAGLTVDPRQISIDEVRGAPTHQIRATKWTAPELPATAEQTNP